MGRVEDATVGGFVDELQGNGLALSDLIAEVDACGCDPDVLFTRGQDVAGRCVDFGGDFEIQIEVEIRVELGAATPAWGLHGAITRPAANSDSADTRFVVHHFHENST